MVFFRSLYSIVSASNFQLVLDQCLSLVTGHMNQSLLRGSEGGYFSTRCVESTRTRWIKRAILSASQGNHSNCVFNLVISFFDTGTSYPNLNKADVALMPKNLNLKKIDQFQPISLCNFSRKIISKVTSNCLKLWLLT